ncbi:DUF2514 family protein [Cupriavidus gilardii]|uniref:DUF2514 domain-containing protein n=1 Tax=Cupriavidus gilardii TaxID=82541 RepID=A0ABY4VP21_9BURK|nr:DUF2514 family protein [Cupriavidus gilardii]MCT9074912.1 DUF2514 domain-containing protein [Cupriavidus gilardii]QKS63401.1 DUF2514 family protein [Cupriavidus gilardii]USE78969.1 DUF2514 domain-containing protein [Cupriavidus gilardii]
MIQATAIRAAAAAVPWRAVAVVVLAGAAFGAGWTVNGWRKGGEIDRLRRGYAEERLAQEVAKVGAVGDARREEQRRLFEQAEIANAAKKEAAKARADARDADAVAGRLRKRVADLVATNRAGGDSAATSGSTAAGDPLGVLADVLSRADRRAGILAEYADAARIAGHACERAYAALTAGAVEQTGQLAGGGDE